jgi:uncharacterized protein YhfF
MRSARTDEFWRAYRDAAGLRHDNYDVVAFGDGAEMATELAELVVAGIKRATAGLVRQFGPDGEPPPVVGGYVVLLDGAGRPRAIWRTTEVRIGPLNSVDERFAWDEGEGERSAIGGCPLIAGSSDGEPPRKVFRCTTRSKPCSSGSRSYGRPK